MLVKHYRDLWVYQRAFQAAMRIFEASKSWPSEERYSLTDQIRRSSRSVCGAVAEAWRKRRYEAHFVSRSEFRPLDGEYDAINAGLVNMMDNAQQWCGPANAVREECGDYNVLSPTPKLPHSQTSPRPHAPTPTLPYTPTRPSRKKDLA